HRRRYSEATISQLLAAHGFAVETVESFNKVALLPWWAYGKILRAGKISKLVLKIFDKSVWFWRRLDILMPWPGLSLVAVGRKATSLGAPASSIVRRETTSQAN
ncbi:MAG: glycosyl transferase, partial [Candidatus Solibacter sp.]|nr:glycosyl transferase [Candidatus Solibacter sp.]